MDNVLDEESWKSFMGRVDKVGKVIKGLASKNENEVNIAKKMADEILGPHRDDFEVDEDQVCIKNDRTVINQAALDAPEPEKFDKPTMDQAAFMRTVEIDVAKRARAKKENKVEAEWYKKEGNIAFRVKDYEKALDRYNKAIKKVGDSCLLYNNRALTCLKLGLYKRVLSDTHYALRIHENNLKALLYKAQAHFHLRDLANYEQTINTACQEHSSKINFIKESQKQWEKEKESKTTEL